jgi:hypothetical protein
MCAVCYKHITVSLPKLLEFKQTRDGVDYNFKVYVHESCHSAHPSRYETIKKIMSAIDINK